MSPQKSRRATAPVPSGPPLYQQIAEKLRGELIEAGGLVAGDRMPGVRRISAQFGVSLATAVAAYRQLEQENVIEARPRSGFFVRHCQSDICAPPRESRPRSWPVPVSGQQRVMQMIEAATAPGILALGAAVPHPSFLPGKMVQRALASASRHPLVANGGYAFPPGYLGLREQLALRMARLGCRVAADDIVITNGGQEALVVALKSLCKEGDIVALESPAFYGLLQIIDSLGLKALEIPTHPDTGLSLEALELALDKWPVKACVVVSNFSNPLGCSLPLERKASLVALLAEREVALVEDDIYGDLHFDAQRPAVAKHFDQRGEVLYCSSFSKTLSPGLRVGWIVPGRYLERVNYHKFVSSSANTTVAQIAVQQLLLDGAFDRHLNRLRPTLRSAVAKMRDRLSHHMPAGTRISHPDGGFVLWLELPKEVDSLALAQQALERQVSIAPGPLFSASEKYRNCLRVSCAQPWDESLERGLATLGMLVREQLGE